jgi:predicted acyltransferase
MSEKLIGKKSDRLLSLDVFRGITIASMVLVNNPGSWGHLYKPVGHAHWNGWTPTDLIFPFFLFIVGVAMTFSFDKRIARGQSKVRLFEQVCKRTIILFLLGLILAGFPRKSICDWGRWRLIAPYIGFITGLYFLFAHDPIFGSGKNQKEKFSKIVAWICLIGSLLYFILDFNYFQTFLTSSKATIRIPGVLQRIAICYFFASIIMFFTKVRGRIIWAAALIIGYWLIMKLLSAPEGFAANVTGQDGLLNEWIDVKLLGSHLYGARPDPEGILSTLPSIATTLLGIICGTWLHSSKDKRDKLLGLFFMGNILLFLGIIMDYGFPINKKIWSSSYVVFTAGMALHFLGMCFYLIDIKGIKKWAYPFMVFGTNPIFLFVASGIAARFMNMIRISNESGGTMGLKTRLYRNLFASWASPLNASLFFAICYVFIWFLIMTPMYRKKIFIKI